MAVCPAPTNAGLVDGLMTTVDCYVATFVHGVYRDLVGPGTLFASAFTVLLTIYIALVGYQLLLGRGGLRVMDLPVMALKIGLILAFLTSWAAYQTVVFNFLFQGPSEIGGVLLNQIGQLGGDADVLTGLEGAFKQMTEAASFYARQAGSTANLLQGGPALGSGILWLSAVGLLLTTVGLVLAAKIILAFLLAIGPIFIGFFLFETTRGLFDGWLRTTLAFALAPLAATVFGAAMLLMLQPFLDALATQIADGRFDMGAIITIAMIVAVFAIVMGLVLRMTSALTGAFSSPLGRRPSSVSQGQDAPPWQAQPILASGVDRAGESAARAGYEASASEPQPAVATAFGADRRLAEVVDAVGPEHATSARLGQLDRRLPRPTRRAGDEA
jgi:type IV secretion system protein VirB6